jgi:hypothetical protein
MNPILRCMAACLRKVKICSIFLLLQHISVAGLIARDDHHHQDNYHQRKPISVVP